MKPKLTIGCACWDDVQGVFWTLSIIRQFHVPVTMKDIELVVIDDMPQKQKELDHVCNLHQAKYIHRSKNMGPAHSKNTLFEEAHGEYTLLLDSHILCLPGSIQYLYKGILENRLGNDIWSGPLVNEAGGIIATELDPQFRGEFFGTWQTDPDIATKRIKEIQGMGSAFFAMRTEQFLKIGGFPKEFRGFAGEEIILSELNRQAGGKHYCHYDMKWEHRFLRDKPVSYTLTINDKYKNYLIGFYKCGWNTTQVKQYFAKKLPADQHQANTAEILRLFPDLFTKNPDAPYFPELD